MGLDMFLFKVYDLKGKVNPEMEKYFDEQYGSQWVKIRCYWRALSLDKSWERAKEVVDYVDYPSDDDHKLTDEEYDNVIEEYWSLTKKSEEIAYWRKANQIHEWFVHNIQNDVDNCEPYEVKRENLEELLNLCRIVKNDHSKAEELLPTEDFHGGAEYDEYYFDDIDKTIKMLTEVLENFDDEDERMYYQSSW